MFWLGLAVSGLWYPGYTGATIQTSYVAMSLFLPLTLWRPVRLTSLHWVLFAFCAIAALSCVWATNPFDAAWGLWQVALFAMAFWLGSSLPDASRLWLGFSIGAAVSACFAIAQWFGYVPFLVWNATAPAGAYYNSMYAGEIFAIAALASIIYRRWWLVPLLIFALAISMSHAGWLAFGLGLVLIRFRSFKLILIIALAAAVVFTFHFRPSDAIRLQVWYAALTNLAWFGHGPGSFLSLWYHSNDLIIFPEYVHNDALQLVFEYGLLAIVPIGLLASPATRSDGREWPVYIAFLFMGLVSFPLYTPVLGFAGALCAGRLARGWSLRRALGPHRRHDLVLRLPTPQPALGHTLRGPLPVVPRA